MTDPSGRQLWLELPPISPAAPRRLLVFLHDAGSSPEYLLPLALGWQLRFPGAIAVLLQGPLGWGGSSDWFDPGARDARGAWRTADAVDGVARRIGQLQRTHGLAPQRTVVVGVGQGATVALQLARAQPAAATIVVGYAARLASPIRDSECVTATVHLIHGAFDSVTPAVHAQRAFRGLRAVGADVTLDIVEDESHVLSQGLVNLGTTRVMQTVFRGRRPAHRPTLH